MELDGSIVERAKLTDGQRLEMFELMTEYYANMDRATFQADLDQKQWIILATEPGTGTIRGFSTQTLIDLSVLGKRIRFLFSGDTIVDQAYWARNPLAKRWGQLALTLLDRNDSGPLYWFLITKGYKTYRYLPVFFHEFYPRYDQPTPDWARTTIDRLASSQFPVRYDREAGIVRASSAGPCLRPGVAAVSEGRLRDANVRFFHRQNPGHSRGEELCCLAPLTRKNFTVAAYRVIGAEPAMESTR